MRSIPRDLFFLCASLFLWSSGEGMFFHFQPIYIQSFDANPAQVGAVLSIAGVALLFCHLPAGYIADRFGCKPVILAGWWLGLAAGGIMFFAQDLTMFTIGLVLYNTTAFVVAANNAYLTAARGSLSVERAITLSAAAYGAGAIVSPAIGGWIAGSWGLRAVYGAACILFLLSCMMIQNLAPRKVIPSEREGRYKALAVNVDFRGIILLGFGAGFAMFLGIALAPSYLRDVRLLSIEQIGLLGSANAIGMVAINALIGKWNPRWGFLLSQGIYLLYAFLLWQGAGFGFFLVAYFLRAGYSGARSAIASLAGRALEGREMGLAYGILETVFAAAIMLAPVSAGLLYSWRPEFPLIASLVLTGATMMAGLWFFRRKNA